MPIPQKLFDLALQLQAFHGWEIKVLYAGRRGPDGAGLWHVRVPATGAEFAGGFRAAIAWLGGYQAGYLGGRRYTGEESGALLDEAKSFFKNCTCASDMASDSKLDEEGHLPDCRSR